MIDLEQTLRSDAERWNARLRPVGDLDTQLTAALSRGPRTRRLLLPLLAAAVVVALAVTLAAVGLSGSGSDRSAAHDVLAPITGVVWKDPRSTATVVYTESTMRLFDGCENELRRLRVERGALVQGARIGEPSFCSGGPASPAERANQRRLHYFYAVVAGPASWTRSGDVLTLTTPGEGILHLTTDRAPAAMLVGTSWRLINFVGTDGEERPASTPLVFAVRDGMFTAGLGCGALVGIARVSPHAIRFVDVSSTSCAAGLHDAGEVVSAVVGAGRADYAIRGDELIIYGSGGRLLIYTA